MLKKRCQFHRSSAGIIGPQKLTKENDYISHSLRTFLVWQRPFCLCTSLFLLAPCLPIQQSGGPKPSSTLEKWSQEEFFPHQLGKFLVRQEAPRPVHDFLPLPGGRDDQLFLQTRWRRGGHFDAQIRAQHVDRHCLQERLIALVDEAPMPSDLVAGRGRQQSGDDERLAGAEGDLGGLLELALELVNGLQVFVDDWRGDAGSRGRRSWAVQLNTLQSKTGK
jgi:hypothetical protein